MREIGLAATARGVSCGFGDGVSFGRGAPSLLKGWVGRRIVALPTTCQRSTMTRYWLMKSEPEECSIDDALAAPAATVAWTGVRNYQARNFMRDAMQVGDGVLFYHSSCAEPGVVGVARVASGTRVDPTQFDPASPYVDLASKPENPRWLLLDIQALRRTRVLGLAALRAHPGLAEMGVLRRGNRLSITPVTDAEWRIVVEELLPPSS
jgi:predicted RNA-binding protein with PUA-like domain